MELIPFGLVLVLAYGVQTATGFGGMLVASVLGSFFLPIETIAPTMTPISLLQTGFIAVRNRRYTDRELLFRSILPGLAVGIPLGALLGLFLDGNALRGVLGLIVGFLVVRDLIGVEPPATPSRVGIVSAGVTQGLMGAGGPLLLWSLGRLSLSPQTLRATLTTVWVITDSLLLGWWIVQNRVNAETLHTSVFLLPAVPLGLLLGEFAFKRLDAAMFKKALTVGLAVMAVLLLVNSLR